MPIMKLPINPLLHLISLGAVGGMVMAGLQLKEHGAEFKRFDGGQVKEVKPVKSVKGDKRASKGRDKRGCKGLPASSIFLTPGH